MEAELVDCPLCESNHYTLWFRENGYNCVRCINCELLYVNPRPNIAAIDSAVQLGSHQFEDGSTLNTKAKRETGKQRESVRVLKHTYADIIASNKVITWLDIGAGYGEFVEALTTILPKGSTVHGIEPMEHKVRSARSNGLPITQGYLEMVNQKYLFVSLIDVFSHIPDFPIFLESIKAVLDKDGEILIKTGNAADIGDRSNFPGPLNMPDHLIFGGVSQLTRFLTDAGFEIVTVNAQRIDGFWYSLKNIVKWLLRRPVCVGLPYRSPTRTLWIRAKLVNGYKVNP